jgi:hypothetical protein
MIRTEAASGHVVVSVTAWTSWIAVTSKGTPRRPSLDSNVEEVTLFIETGASKSWRLRCEFVAWWWPCAPTAPP